MSTDTYYENEDTDYPLIDYDYLYEIIFDACANDDVDALVALQDGTHACMNGHAFEEANIDLNQLEDDDYCNPLFLACHYGNLRVVKELLKMSADIDYPSGEGDQATGLITGTEWDAGAVDLFIMQCISIWYHVMQHGRM